MPIDLHGPGMWYATRAAGLVTLLMLTASVLLGVMTAGRFSSDRWPRFLTAGLHRNISLLAETARVVRYLADENAGQCGPCMFGLPALADAMAELACHGGQGRALERAASLAGLVAGRGACRHPDGAVQLMRSALRAFETDARWHDHRARARVWPGLRCCRSLVRRTGIGHEP